MTLYMYNDTKKRQDRPPEFFQVPPTEEEKWRFGETKKLASYSPTRDYISSFAHNMLSGIAGMGTPDLQFKSPYMKDQKAFGGWQMPKFDISNLPQSWKPDYIRPEIAQEKADATNPALAPTPPPELYRAGKGDRYGQTARNLMGYFGINGGTDKDIKRENETKAKYDAWLQQYGESFTDAQGNKIPAPKNMEEYMRWYEMKYGVPYKG